MSKRDTILAAIKDNQWQQEYHAKRLAEYRTLGEALLAALYTEEEAILYDDYVARQEAAMDGKPLPGVPSGRAADR